MTLPRPIPLSPRLRFFLSALLIGHLLAVIAPPLSFQTRGPLGQSPVVATVLAPVEGYSQAMYMDRGYAFFAPDPGPSHLIQAAITSKDGSRVETMFPDLDEQWPRLLYHRHFMLSEYLTEVYFPPGPPRELAKVDPIDAENWVRARARYEHVRQSIVGHLQRRYPGQDVAIRRVEHLIPDLVAFQQSPVALDDPRFYQVMLDVPVGTSSDGTGRGEDLIAPSRPPESVPPPPGAEQEATDAKPQPSLTDGAGLSMSRNSTESFRLALRVPR